MSSYTTSPDLAERETTSLIAASKVNGTTVYNPAGDSLGSIHDVMLDKRSGHVTFAVLSFGGFLGMGAKYHPLPWNKLTYDERQGGYVVDLDKSVLEGAPAYAASDSPDWDNGRYGNTVDEYYAAFPLTPRGSRLP